MICTELSTVSAFLSGARVQVLLSGLQVLSHQPLCPENFVAGCREPLLAAKTSGLDTEALGAGAAARNAKAAGALLKDY